MLKTITTVSPRKIGWAMLLTFLGLSLLSFSFVWWKYHPRGVDRYFPTVSEQMRVIYVTTPDYPPQTICFDGAAFMDAGRVK